MAIIDPSLGMGPLGIPSSDWYTTAFNPTYNNQLEEIDKRVSAIEDRLAILRINETLHEKYPALKEAYEHYKLIEKLVKEQSNDN